MGPLPLVPGVAGPLSPACSTIAVSGVPVVPAVALLDDPPGGPVPLLPLPPLVCHAVSTARQGCHYTHS